MTQNEIKLKEGKEKLENLILAILNKAGEVPKKKLAKLILFAEIEHYKKTGKSITGLYFVRLALGPVIAFFDDVLEKGEGKSWQKRVEPVFILEEGKEKSKYLYKAKKPPVLSKKTGEIINKVIKKYNSFTGTRLSYLSHDLIAWRHSEPNEPIYLAELVVKDEEEYFALIDLVEEIEEEPNDHLAEILSSALSRDKESI